MKTEARELLTGLLEKGYNKDQIIDTLKNEETLKTLGVNQEVSEKADPSFCLMTERSFSRTVSGKSWRGQADKITTESLTKTQYTNITGTETQKQFRRLGGNESATYGYIKEGYLIIRLISCNPTRTIRVVRTFKAV